MEKKLLLTKMQTKIAKEKIDSNSRLGSDYFSLALVSQM